VTADDLVQLDVEVLRETEKALLVRAETGDEVWIPKSVVDDDSECFSLKSSPGSMTLPAWFARKERLV
jgi:hypothetical protein